MVMLGQLHGVFAKYGLYSKLIPVLKLIYLHLFIDCFIKIDQTEYTHFTSSRLTHSLKTAWAMTILRPENCALQILSHRASTSRLSSMEQHLAEA